MGGGKAGEGGVSCLLPKGVALNTYTLHTRCPTLSMSITVDDIYKIIENIMMIIIIMFFFYELAV